MAVHAGIETVGMLADDPYPGTLEAALDRSGLGQTSDMLQRLAVEAAIQANPNYLRQALMMDPLTNSPIVVLQDTTSETLLPIWVGIFEANAIALQI